MIGALAAQRRSALRNHIPESARASLTFLWAERVEDVTKAALEPAAAPAPAEAAE